MKNNRRLYKRILAIMLVILLVLPQGISSVVSRAEGETANASWSDDLATLTATFDNLGENTIMAATATPDGKSTVEGAVSGNQVTFSITDKIRKDTNISFNLFKASEENPEVADTTPFATVQWNNDKNNFEVTSNDISVVIDNNNTVTISITGDAASYAYLSDFSSTVTVTVDSKSCTKDMPAGTSLEFTSSDGDLANANYKTDQKANVSFADTSIAQIDLDILTERLIWSNGSIEASINEENVLTISTNSSAPAADLSKYAASVSVSVAGETAKTISFSEGSASVTQDLDDYGWYLKEGDTVSLSFKDRTDAASVVTNINNLKVGSTNYYTINVTGDVTVTGNGVKDNKILKTSTDKSAKVIAEGKFISSIKVDGVDKTSNVEIESESKEFKRTVYAISEINSDININVETIDKTGLVTLSTTELSPLFSYGITVKSLPYIIADNISYDCGDSVSEDKVEHFLSISGTTIAVKYESGDNKITSVTGTPTDTNPITTGFSINYYLKDSSDNDIKMGTLTGTVKVDALCNYIDGIKFTSKKTGEEIAAYQKNNIYLLAGDASVNIYLNDAGKSKLKKYRFNGDTTTIPSDGKITFSVDKEEDVELEFIATSEGSSDEKIFSALKFGVDATKPTVTDINCTNEGTVEEKKNDITEQAEGKVITFSFGDTNSGIDYTINKPFVSMTENATSSDLQEGDNGEQGDKFEFEIGKGKLTLKKLRKIPANYYIHVFDNVGNEKIYTLENVGIISQASLDAEYNNTAGDVGVGSDESGWYFDEGDMITITATGQNLRVNKAVVTYSNSSGEQTTEYGKDKSIEELFKITTDKLGETDETTTYEYTVPKPNDMKDGAVTIVVTASNGGRTLDKTIKFTYDNTAPVVEKSEIKDSNKVISSEKSGTVTDENKSSLKKSIEFTEISEANAEKIIYSIGGIDTTEPTTDGKFDDPFIIDNISTDYGRDGRDVVVTFIDKAGNKTTKKLHIGPVVEDAVLEPNINDTVYSTSNKQYNSSVIVHAEAGVTGYFEFSSGSKKATVTATNSKAITNENERCEYEFKCNIPSKWDDGTDIGKVVGGDKVSVKFYLDDEQCTDYTQKSVDAGSVIIDNTTPTISFNPNIPENGYLKQDTPWGTTVNATNDSIDTVTATVKVDREAGDLDANLQKAFTYDENGKGSWNFDSKQGTNSEIITLEGVYEVTLVAKNKAGATATKSISFTYDKTAPSLSSYKLSNGGDGITIENGSDYQIFDNKLIRVDASIFDSVSGLDKVKIIGTPNTEGLKSEVYWESSDLGGVLKKNDITYNIASDFKGTISLVLTDKAGNSTTLSKKFNDAETDGKTGVVRESEKLHSQTSGLSFTTNNASARVIDDVEYYKGDVIATFLVNDDISGIRELKINDNSNVDIRKYTGNKITLNATETYKIPGAANNGSHTISGSFVDNSGNQLSAAPKTVMIDTVAPVISMSFDKTNATTYYNTSRVATITITDKNFYDKETIITVTKNGQAEKVSNNFSGNGDVKTMNYSFDEDGDYTIKVEATDKAGNVAKSVEESKFTIDKTNPKLTLTFNNNNVHNEKYYNAERIGTLTVEEHNFDASLIDVRVTVSDSAEGVGTPGVGGFSTNGDTHTASIPFSQDATYEITVTGKDLADNNADQTITENFIVDLTNPEIKISNVEDDVVYADQIRPDIEVTDRNYDNNGTVITLVSMSDNGKAGKNLEDTYSASSIANGEKFTYTNFNKDEENDQYFALKAVAQDMAGNTSEKTINFMVNRFGSWFDLNKYTEDLVKAVYTNLEGEGDIVIAAHNFSKIEETQVYFTVGEEQVVLKKDDGYKVSSSTDDNHIINTAYTIDKSKLESEGEYNIVVSTKDSEGNTADNETKDAPVKFVIDRTSPEYIISGIENNGVYENQDQVSGSIELHDNIGVGKAVITLDGTKKAYEAKELEEMDYTVPVEFKKGTHTIEVKVIDLAGNESADDEGISFSVNQTAIERAVTKAAKNYWWLFIIIGVVVIGGVIFFVVKRQQNEE